jgi:hypothetical protein
MELVNTKQLAMAKRVYNNKMQVETDKDGKVVASDEEALKMLISNAFTSNNEINKIQAYRDFNKLIVTTAEAVAEPDIQRTINLVAQYQKVGANDVAQYDLKEIRTRVTTAFTATGTGVDFTRIPNSQKKVFAIPRKHQFGVKYNVSRLISDPVNEFNNAVDYVAQEKVKYVMKQIYSVLRQAVTASKIPSKQMVDQANVTVADFRTVEASLLRYGRNVKPVMIADSALIDSLAQKQAQVAVTNVTTQPLYLTDELRQSLLRDIQIDQISRTMAISIDNPFVDKMNSKVDLSFNEGIMVAGGASSPFRVTDFGDMAILSDELDVETEDVNMKISYKTDVTLLLTQAVGYIRDTSVLI